MRVTGSADETLVSMFPGDALGRLTLGVFDAVGKSYVSHKMNNPTRQEHKRRFDICIKWARIFYGDLKWGLERVCDQLPTVLKAELSGQDYTPPTREIWVPEDGRRRDSILV